MIGYIFGGKKMEIYLGIATIVGLLYIGVYQHWRVGRCESAYLHHHKAIATLTESMKTGFEDCIKRFSMQQKVNIELEKVAGSHKEAIDQIALVIQNTLNALNSQQTESETKPDGPGGRETGRMC